MADLRRLGKRGSYRLGGQLGGGHGGRGGRGGPASFGSRQSRISPWWWLAIVLAGALVIAVTAELGLWFIPFLAGLAMGLIAPRRGWRLRHTLPAVLVMTLIGWGVPLYWLALVQGQPAGATARVIAALAGVAAARGHSAYWSPCSWPSSRPSPASGWAARSTSARAHSPVAPVSACQRHSARSTRISASCRRHRRGSAQASAATVSSGAVGRVRPRRRRAWRVPFGWGAGRLGWG